MYVFKKIRKTVAYFETIALEDAEEEEKDGYWTWLDELYNVWESPMARLEDYTRYGHLDSIIRKGGKLIKA